VNQKKRRNIIIAAVVGVAVLVPLLSVVIATSGGYITVGSLGCDARVDRLTKEHESQVQAFERRDFLPGITHEVEFQTSAGGDCVSNPATVRSMQTYVVNSSYGPVLEQLDDTLKASGLEFERGTRGVFAKVSACGDNSTSTRLKPITETSQSNGVRESYSVSTTYTDSSCDFGSADKSQKFFDESEVRFLPVEEIKIEQVFQFAS